MDTNVKLPQVKIECFAISLQSNSKKDEESKNIGLNSFRKLKVKSDEKEGDKKEYTNQDFISFFRIFVKSFNKKFAVYPKEAKGVFVASTEFNSAENIISGTVEGGTTNTGTKFKTKNNTKEEDAIPISPEHVDAHPYYFLLWFPPNKSFGYLIIQSLSNKSITSIFKRHLERFVKKEYDDVYLLITKKTPEEIANIVKSESSISKITLKQSRVPKEVAKKLLNIDYSIDEDLTFTLTITGIKKMGFVRQKIEQAIKQKDKKIFDFEELRKLGFDGSYRTSIEYDNNGNKNSVYSDDSFEFKPSLYLKEDEFKRDINFFPTYYSLNKYCRNLLNSLKGEDSQNLDKDDLAA